MVLRDLPGIYVKLVNECSMPYSRWYFNVITITTVFYFFANENEGFCSSNPTRNWKKKDKNALQTYSLLACSGHLDSWVRRAVREQKKIRAKIKPERERERDKERGGLWHPSPPQVRFFFLLRSPCAVPTIWTPGKGLFIMFVRIIDFQLIHAIHKRSMLPPRKVTI